METYAPAAVLINRKHECLYSLGPTDRYLRVVPGRPLHDLLAMARQGMRTKLRSAIQRAIAEKDAHRRSRRTDQRGLPILGSFSIAVRPVSSEGEELLLVCFVDDPKVGTTGANGRQRDVPGVAELEQELEVTRSELAGRDPQPGDFRAKNRRRSTKKPYRSGGIPIDERGAADVEGRVAVLNEELTALNSQLQETLERQRTTPTICRTSFTAPMSRRCSLTPI